MNTARRNDPRLDSFLAQCESYLAKLRTAGDFGEILGLWRQTNLPYTMPAIDPLSDAYREHVLDVYRALTKSGYTASNELTSTKQSADSFSVGYPWISKRLDIVAPELAKTTQALSALARPSDEPQDIIEFGSGWGNLMLPLAKAGQNVTAVDIDEGFLTRLTNIFDREGLKVRILLGDFLEVARGMTEKYDAVIFQSSFHHCIEFDALLSHIRHSLLKENGRILFLAEPIHPNFAFPWGLRFDGESLWAIMCNQWLELGFDQGFFLDLLARHDLLAAKVPALGQSVGEGWKAVRAEDGLDFAEWALTDAYDQGFWPRDANGAYGRFMRAKARLPRLRGGGSGIYELTLTNFAARSLTLTMKGDGLMQRTQVALASGETRTIRTPECRREDLRLSCETIVPHRLIGNGDQREIGCAFIKLRIPTQDNQ